MVQHQPTSLVQKNAVCLVQVIAFFGLMGTLYAIKKLKRIEKYLSQSFYATLFIATNFQLVVYWWSSI